MIKERITLQAVGTIENKCIEFCELDYVYM